MKKKLLHNLGIGFGWIFGVIFGVVALADIVLFFLNSTSIKFRFFYLVSFALATLLFCLLVHPVYTLLTNTAKSKIRTKTRIILIVVLWVAFGLANAALPVNKLDESPQDVNISPRSVQNEIAVEAVTITSVQNSTCKDGVPCLGNNKCERGEFGTKDCPSCYDNNICTKDDYDYQWDKCVYYNITPCCGDGVCENSETRETCSNDCPLKFGDPVKAGNFNWYITGYNEAYKIGQPLFDDFYGVYADGVYIILNVQVENMANTAKILDEDFVKLVDDKGREFSPDTTAGIYLPGDTSLKFEQINPGIVKKGKIVYDVPKDVNIVNVRILSNVAESSFYDVRMIN